MLVTLTALFGSAVACTGAGSQPAAHVAPPTPPVPTADNVPSRCLVPNSELRDLVTAVSDKQRNVGLQVAVWRNGEMAYTLALGLADVEHRTPVTDETRFGIASVTKLFTAVSVLKASAAREIDLDASVQTYLPTFPEKPEGAITLRMLVTHRSGLPHPRDRTPALLETHYDTATAALEVFENAPLLFAPGTDQRYSSSNYNLLAAILETVRGERFVDLVSAELFSSLGLTRTAFDDVWRTLPDRSRRYSYYHPRTYEESDELYVVPRWDYSFNTGGGNIVSTASDLVRFGAALLEPGLLENEEWEQLFSAEWFGAADETKTIYVSGANPGLQAGLAIHPETGSVAAVLANTWGVGSRSGEMTKLAPLLATRCAGVR